MSQRTLMPSSFESYLGYEGDLEEVRGREERMQQFPHAVMVELSYPELDYAMRWCWKRFGPMDG